MEGNPTESTCEEPRGIIVSCSKEQWEHIANHKEMVEQQGIVKAILEKPDFICQCPDFKNRNAFYKRIVLQSVSDTYIRIVVRYRRKSIKNKRGYLVTALATDGAKKGEVVIWKKTK